MIRYYLKILTKFLNLLKKNKNFPNRAKQNILNENDTL